MANWQEDNLSTNLEYPFDFDRYIAEQLREIDDLDERRFAKTVLVEGLGRMIHQTEQKYQEISIPNNQYEMHQPLYGGVIMIPPMERYFRYIH